MGYEIAGGLGTKLAMTDREVWVLVGDGSYLMMNSEIATSVMLDKKLNIVVLDNGGFGCIDRLQRSCGGASFNNLFANGSGIDSPAMPRASLLLENEGKPVRERRSSRGGPEDRFATHGVAGCGASEGPTSRSTG